MTHIIHLLYDTHTHEMLIFVYCTFQSFVSVLVTFLLQWYPDGYVIAVIRHLSKATNPQIRLLQLKHPCKEGDDVLGCTVVVVVVVQISISSP